MHQKDKHRVTVHSFAELAGHRKPLVAVVPFWACMVALIVSMASAGFYALLVRFGFPLMNVPIWAPAVAAQVFGIATGFFVLLIFRRKIPKSDAIKDSSNGRKKAA